MKDFLKTSRLLALTVIVGALNFIPVMVDPSSSTVEDSIYAVSITSDIFRGGSLAILSLLVPLGVDVVFDVINGEIYNAAMTSKSKVEELTVNNLETIAFIVGLAMWPISAFLPDSMNSALVSLCFRNAGISLVAGAFVTSLSRYGGWSKSARPALLSLLAITSLCIGGILSTCSESAHSGTGSSYKLHLSAQAFTFAGGAVILFMCARWLLFVVNTRTRRNPNVDVDDELSSPDDLVPSPFVRHLTRGSSRMSSLRALIPRNSRNVSRIGHSAGSSMRSSKKKSIAKSLSDDYLFFRVVHVTAGMIYVALAVYLNGSYRHLSELDGHQLFVLLVPNIIFALSMVIFAMRKSKYAAVGRLSALLDAKKQYVRYISHEIRTPLNAASLGLKLLLEQYKDSNDEEDQNCHETLSDINVSCVAAIDILNDLLCFDKLESGLLELHKTDEPVIPFVEGCVKMFSAQARERRVAIDLVTRHEAAVAPEEKQDSDRIIGDRRPPSPVQALAGKVGDEEVVASLENSVNSPIAGLRAALGIGSGRRNLTDMFPTDIVTIDKFKMDQVIRNLISNALKFSPKDSKITVEVGFVPLGRGLRSDSTVASASSAQAHKISRFTRFFSWQVRNRKVDDISQRANERDEGYKSPGKLVINVIDQGPGISLDNQQRLFNEVVQFNPEKLQGGGGSGFGLYITKGIVDLHQGTIKVSSKGEGHGCTFTVELPMHRDERHTNKKGQSPADVDAAALRGAVELLQADSSEQSRPPEKHPEDVRDEVAAVDSALAPTYHHERASISPQGNNNYSASSARNNRDPPISLDISCPDPDSSKMDDEAAASAAAAWNQTAGYFVSVAESGKQLAHRRPSAISDNSVGGGILRDVAKANMKAYHKGVGVQKSAEVKSGLRLVHQPSSCESVTRKGRLATLELLGPSQYSLSCEGRSADDEQKQMPQVQSKPKPRYHLLVVDDSHLNRKMLGKLLRAKGHTCEEAEDGDVAVEMVKKIMTGEVDDAPKYDCILMDYVMPTMEGPVAASELRKIGYKGRIVGLTGNGLPADIAHYLAHGADQVFVKPVDVDSFEKYMARSGRVLADSKTDK